jgi:hypothetical protein
MKKGQIMTAMTKRHRKSRKETVFSETYAKILKKVEYDERGSEYDK